MSKGNRGGRKPKPSAVKKRQGNPGHRPINENEPAFEGKTTAPLHLDTIAKTEWRRLAPRLFVHNMLTPADRTAFAAYCSAYSRLAQAERFLASSAAGGSLVYKTEGGAIKPWPHVGIAERAAVQMHRFSTEFGLTPSARSRLNIPDPKKPSSDEDFLFGDDGESAIDECENDAAN
jgi:P27 family predicted phage terminase small subunit